MNEHLRNMFITILIVLLVGGFFVNMNNHYQDEIDILEERNRKLYDAWKKANDKPACQLIQERYNDRMLDENGIDFITEYHPRQIACNDTYDYQGGKIVNG